MAAPVQPCDSASWNSHRHRKTMNKRKEFGDFQTPQELATKVTSLVSDIYGNPDLVVEPIDHAAILNGRKSSIYKNRPRFSVFGIGKYSFSSWKVAISGLYKSFSFSVVPPLASRPVMVDDTCYSIPCNTEAEARLLCDLLSSEPALAFLRSLVFADAKRPITIDVLRRISFVSVAQQLGRLEELEQFIYSEEPNFETERQMTLLMEPKSSYSV